ncbi:MAG: hypothetical protein WB439_13720 [Acidobacteriaceae bacterium]
MDFAFILISLCLVLAAYVNVSLHERSFVNAFTPALTFLLPADYLLELYHLWLFGPSASHFAYALIYACYAGTFCAFTLAYTTVDLPSFRLPFSAPSGTGSRYSSYVMLACALALYAPILIQFKGHLTDPRRIYELTRIGTGTYFFLSATLCYLALVIFLFKRRLSTAETTAFSIICMLFLWLHGSKNQMLLVVFILTTYWVYVRGWRVSFPKFLAFGSLLGGLGIGLFLITSPMLILGQEGLRGIASYSDYTRNGMLLIDSGLGPTYGTLTLQNELYSFIPRPLFPEKPRDFGSLYLAEYFYPYQFERAQGAPAFSYGTELADFGPLALPLLVLLNILAGVALRLFMNSLRRYKDPGSFTMVLFAMGLSIIPISANFLLPESMLLGIIVNAMHSFRLPARPSTDESADIHAPAE